MLLNHLLLSVQVFVTSGSRPLVAPPPLQRLHAAVEEIVAATGGLAQVGL